MGDESFASAVNGLYQAFGDVAEQRNENCAVVHVAALHMACVAAIIDGASEAAFVAFARETFQSAMASRPPSKGDA